MHTSRYILHTNWYVFEAVCIRTKQTIGGEI